MLNITGILNTIYRAGNNDAENLWSTGIYGVWKRWSRMLYYCINNIQNIDYYKDFSGNFGAYLLKLYNRIESIYRTFIRGIPTDGFPENNHHTTSRHLLLHSE